MSFIVVFPVVWLLLRLLPPFAVSADGIYGHSFWGFQRFVRWQDITRIRPFKFFTLTYLRIYAVDRKVTWLALFLADDREFRQEIQRFIPADSPVLDSIHWSNSLNSLASLTDQDDREFVFKLKQFRWEQLKILIIGAIAIVAVSLLFTYQQSQLAEQFATAVEQLGHRDSAVRIGGIYTLERIAQDSPTYHATVMELLTAYVRERSPLPEEPNVAKPREAEVDPSITALAESEVAEDIQAISSVFRRRVRFRDERDLDLRHVNLTGADFYKANLRLASFFGSDLSGVILVDANLTEADLSLAVLYWANLKDATLTKADLAYANLRGARNVTDTQLQSARLCKTKLPKNSKLNPDRDCQETGAG